MINFSKKIIIVYSLGLKINIISGDNFNLAVKEIFNRINTVKNPFSHSFAIAVYVDGIKNDALTDFLEAKIKTFFNKLREAHERELSKYRPSMGSNYANSI